MSVLQRDHLHATYDVRQMTLLGQSVTRPGSALVRRYLDPRLGRVLAGKQLEPAPHMLGRPKEEWLPQLLTEGRLQQQLADHDAILDVVGVLDAVDRDGRSTGHVEIFTPWLERGSAFDCVQRSGPMRPDEAVRIIRDAAKGLAAVHRLGFVHRDVKPLNIFVQDTPSGVAGLLADFGIADEMDEHGWAEGFAQPTPWIAPEQFAGGRPVRIETDLFGLAASLVDLVQPLVTGPVEAADIGRRMLRGWLPLPLANYRPPPLLPRSVRTMVRKLTDPDPSKRRPSTALGVADALSIAVPPWRELTSTGGEVVHEALGTIAIRVVRKHRPLARRWDVRIEADKGNGYRAVGGPRRFDELNAGDLDQLFDEARTIWSR